MQANLPLPTFEDFRKLVQFWFDQQDKWFYFETYPTDYSADSTHEGGIRGMFGDVTRSVAHPNLFQERIVGQVSDVISHPPSLLLKPAHIVVAKLELEGGGPMGSGTRLPVAKAFKTRTVDEFGLVFGRIYYYEPIKSQDHIEFMETDPRWKLDLL